MPLYFTGATIIHSKHRKDFVFYSQNLGKLGARLPSTTSEVISAFILNIENKQGHYKSSPIFTDKRVNVKR